MWGGQVELRAYMTILGQASGSGPAFRMLGYYEAVVLKSDNGWRLARLVINIDHPNGA